MARKEGRKTSSVGLPLHFEAQAWEKEENKNLWDQGAVHVSSASLLNVLQRMPSRPTTLTLNINKYPTLNIAQINMKYNKLTTSKCKQCDLIASCLCLISSGIVRTLANIRSYMQWFLKPCTVKCITILWAVFSPFFFILVQGYFPVGKLFSDTWYTCIFV